MIIAGIDYSFNSPAVCIHKGTDWSINNCTFYYFTTKKKFLLETEQFRGSLYPDYSSQQERFDNLSNWTLKQMNEQKVQSVGLEGYSYGSSSSRLFEIGENTGLLKFKMWSYGIDFDVYAPSAIKKHGCGKGNAGKDLMWDAFIKETDLNIFHLLGQEVGKNWNPVSDMVDAYFICKLRHFSVDKCVKTV
jgi:Holliday junction resolvasome RuvABC endonuclease subunit